jgi:exodeoxyribonuclease VII small subunit
MTKNPKSYKEMMTEVDKILSELKTGEVDVDLLVGKVHNAKEMLDAMQKRLSETQKEIEKLDLDSENRA